MRVKIRTPPHHAGAVRGAFLKAMVALCRTRQRYGSDRRVDQAKEWCQTLRLSSRGVCAAGRPQGCQSPDIVRPDSSQRPAERLDRSDAKVETRATQRNDSSANNEWRVRLEETTASAGLPLRFQRFSANVRSPRRVIRRHRRQERWLMNRRPMFAYRRLAIPTNGSC
jgi:hypothetical protein